MNLTSINELYSIYLRHSHVVKDTREIKKGSLFFALKGANFDANNFADEAIENGASYVVIDNANKKKDDRYLLVKDSLECLQNLAKHHRNQLNIPVLGITGSNGKTTNKELIHSVISQKYHALATAGNYNNHIGVPLTLLRINMEHEFAIIEMGANHQKEIEFLCSIANPNFGLITNIGKAHLEGFGGLEGVKKGKSELYRHIESKKGKLFLNQDDETLKSLIHSPDPITYGVQNKSYCEGKIDRVSPNILGVWHCNEHKGKIRSSLFGEYNFYNILAAVCIANYFKVDPDQIDKGIESYHAENNRSEIKHYRGASIYLDAYNANPSSMEASLRHFSHLEGQNKLVILGDMYEIGEQTDSEHERVVALCKELKINSAVFIGEHFYKQRNNVEHYHFFKSREEATHWLNQENIENKTILIKASRGMALEKLIS